MVQGDYRRFISSRAANRFLRIGGYPSNGNRDYVTMADG
jgi:hypothetical protein